MQKIIFKIQDVLCVVVFNGLIYSAYLVTKEGNREYLQHWYTQPDEAVDEATKKAKSIMEAMYAN